MPTILLVQGLRELVDAGRHFQPLIKDLLLALETNVLGPANVSSEVPLGLNSATYKIQQHTQLMLSSRF